MILKLAMFCLTQNVTNNEWWLNFEEFVLFFSQSAVFLAALLSAAKEEYRVSSRREESWNMEPDSSWRWCHSCVFLHLHALLANAAKKNSQTLHVWPKNYYYTTTRVSKENLTEFSQEIESKTIWLYVDICEREREGYWKVWRILKPIVVQITFMNT